MGWVRCINTGRPRLFGPVTRKSRARVIPVVLLALALRTLIPLGFMPAADGTLSLMICPAGFSLELLASEKMMMSGGMAMPQHPQPAPGHGAMDSGYCIFSTGFSAAPPPLVLTALSLLIASFGAVALLIAAPVGIRLVHIPQARAPPAIR